MSKVRSNKLLVKLLRNIKDKDEIALMLIKGLNVDNSVSVLEVEVPYGKMWIIRPTKTKMGQDEMSAAISLVEDKNNQQLILNVKLNDGKDTTYNHNIRHTYNENDSKFFNLLLLINNHSLFRDLVERH